MTDTAPSPRSPFSAKINPPYEFLEGEELEEKYSSIEKNLKKRQTILVGKELTKRERKNLPTHRASSQPGIDREAKWANNYHLRAYQKHLRVAKNAVALAVPSASADEHQGKGLKSFPT